MRSTCCPVWQAVTEKLGHMHVIVRGSCNTPEHTGFAEICYNTSGFPLICSDDAEHRFKLSREATDTIRAWDLNEGMEPFEIDFK